MRMSMSAFRNAGAIGEDRVHPGGVKAVSLLLVRAVDGTGPGLVAPSGVEPWNRINVPPTQAPFGKT